MTTLHEGKHLRFRKTGHWEFVERVGVHGTVAILAVTPEQNLLLTEQFRPPLDRNVIELPAGLAGDDPAHHGEELANAARRELLEETGYDASCLRFLVEGPSSAGLTNETVAFFLATGLTRHHAGGGVENENIIVHEVPLKTIDEWLASRSAHGCAIDFKVYAALYLLGIS